MKAMSEQVAHDDAEMYAAREEAAEASGVEPPTEDEPASESNAEQLENQGHPPGDELAPAVDTDLTENSATAEGQAAEDPEHSEQPEPEKPESEEPEPEEAELTEED
jgi:hypothetical protein